MPLRVNLGFFDSRWVDPRGTLTLDRAPGVARARALSTAQECIKVADDIRMWGSEMDPVTYNEPCMACDPTQSRCPKKCQSKVNSLYTKCDGVRMPDGFFFDPNKELTGELSALEGMRHTLLWQSPY